MSEKFLDTNILVYAYQEIDRLKADRAQIAMRDGFIIGVQTLNEFVNVGRRRLRWDWAQCRVAVAEVKLLAFQILPTELEDHQLSLTLAERHQLAILDALMLAIALRAGCATFYSEDMQHGFQVEDRMTVLSPFA